MTVYWFLSDIIIYISTFCAYKLKSHKSHDFLIFVSLRIFGENVLNAFKYIDTYTYLC